MTRERTKELLPVLTAWSKGQDIQWTSVVNQGFGWRDLLGGANFADTLLSFRIKPKPREWWLASGMIQDDSCLNVYDNEDRANLHSPDGFPPIHVREVL